MGGAGFITLLNVFACGCGEGSSPLGAKVILYGKRDSDQDTNGTVNVCLFVGVQILISEIGDGEECAGEIPDTGCDVGEVSATIPKVTPRSFIAEDEHQTDDYGHGRDLFAILVNGGRLGRTARTHTIEVGKEMSFRV